MAKKRTTKKTTGTRRRRGRTRGPMTLTESAAALLKDLVEDLRAAVDEDAGLKTRLDEDFRNAKEVGRTGLSLVAWLDGELEQVAASWVLSVVFVRFCEDNGLIEHPRIAGPRHEDPARDRLRLAGEHQRRYHDRHPSHGDREYLESVFRELAELPGLGPILGPEGDERTGGHAAWSRIPLRPEGARTLLEWARGLDDAGDQVRFTFASESLDTRFLGDLYQDLSEAARKRFALLQTPDFVESFILDRTLEPALKEFAEEFERGEFRMIDPTCGSGHFLLGGFERLVRHWGETAPGLDVVERTRRSLESVWGVDLNPFAAAIARFRLLVAALRQCGIERLKDAPDFPVHVAAGDSLFFGSRFDVAGGRAGQLELGGEDPYQRATMATEDPVALRQTLNQRYHAVVGNPPYITPKDPALRDAYRERYGSCYREYALSVPFMERFMDLAVPGDDTTPAGFVGKITANSFMKREFGKVLVEQYFPRWDLNYLIDTSGAYIPGHGTPTVVLLLRARPPVSDEVVAVFGVRGEPRTPVEPAQGRVWRSIVEHVGRPGHSNAYVSSERVGRSRFSAHPMLTVSAPVIEVLDAMEAIGAQSLGEIAASIGFVCITKEDNFFVQEQGTFARLGVEFERSRSFGAGDQVRDWRVAGGLETLFPYDETLQTIDLRQWPGAFRVLWPHRTVLGSRQVFGGMNYRQAAKPWWEYGQIPIERFRVPLSIAFAFVATHNHFVLDRGGKVFNRSAPVIKLPADATEEDHLALLAVLNSSAVCFWGRQTLFDKGGGGIGGGLATEAWEKFQEWDATKLKMLPVIAIDDGIRDLASRLHRLAAASSIASDERLSSVGAARLQADDAARLSTLISLQEELDWRIYEAYGFVHDSPVATNLDDLPTVALGQRAFEIVLARRMAAGELETTWFERHGSTPITEIPGDWPEWYRDIVARRIELIESHPAIGLIEQPECKRRWNVEPFESRLARAVDSAILDAVEKLPVWRDEHPRPMSLARLADVLAADADVRRLVELKTGDSGADLLPVLESLVVDDAVPFSPSLYLTPSGMRKRAAWEETWRLQRLEDPFLDRQDEVLREHFGESPEEQAFARKHVAEWLKSNGRALGPSRVVNGLREDEKAVLTAVRDRWLAIDAERKAAIGGGDTPPVPPKYGSGDFRSATFWRLRGKLDVPKERFISYPGLSPDGDDTLLVGWAGWDHAQQAAALMQVVQDRMDSGWEGERLVPALQGLDQLVFWLEKWHGVTEFGNLGELYGAQVQELAGRFGMTLDEVRAWRP